MIRRFNENPSEDFFGQGFDSNISVEVLDNLNREEGETRESILGRISNLESQIHDEPSCYHCDEGVRHADCKNGFELTRINDERIKIKIEKLKTKLGQI